MSAAVKLNPLLPGVVLALAAAALYVRTMAPSITWKNGGTDGAELAAAAYVWGVAHPPGYPLYLSLVRLFQFLPVGDPAYRAGLFSATCSALACLVAFGTTLRLLSSGASSVSWREIAGALFAAGSFAFGELLWSQSTFAEVYGLTELLFACVLFLLAGWLQAPTQSRWRLLVLALALLISHHPPFAFALLPLALLAWRQHLPARLWAEAAAILLVVPLLFLSLMLRASFAPPIDWGVPTTLPRLWDQVTASIYRGYVLALPLPAEIARLPAAVRDLVSQGGWLAATLSLAGFAWLWSARPVFSRVVLLLALYFLLFATVYNAANPQRYLLPAVQIFALSAGVGATWLLYLLPRSFPPLLPLVLAGSIVWQIVYALPHVDLSGDREASDWALQTLDSAPANAVIHSTDDSSTFALWYMQATEGRRRDVAVVEDRLLAYPWYHDLLLHNYPWLTDQALAPV